MADTQIAIREVEVTLVSNTTHEDLAKITFTAEMLHRLKMGAANWLAPSDPRAASGSRPPSLPPILQKH